MEDDDAYIIENDDDEMLLQNIQIDAVNDNQMGDDTETTTSADSTDQEERDQNTLRGIIDRAENITDIVELAVLIEESASMYTCA